MATVFHFPSPFYKGDKVLFSFTKDGSDGLGPFTDYSVKMQWRDKEGNLALEFSSDANTIICDPSSLTFNMDSSSFSVVNNGAFRYDLEFTDSVNDKFTALYGQVRVIDEQTKN